jgi:hypothetical protein
MLLDQMSLQHMSTEQMLLDQMSLQQMSVEQICDISLEHVIITIVNRANDLK